MIAPSYQFLQDQHYSGNAKDKYMNKARTKPAKLMMDDAELFDLLDIHRKAGVDIQAACTGSLCMISIQQA